jgi:hypothetical protein
MPCEGEPSEREALACHEAGHAIAALALGRLPQLVPQQVGPVPPGGGGAARRKRSPRAGGRTHDGAPQSPGPDQDPRLFLPLRGLHGHAPRRHPPQREEGAGPKDGPGDSRADEPCQPRSALVRHAPSPGRPSSWRGPPLQRFESQAARRRTPLPCRAGRGSGEEASEPLPQRGPEHGERPPVSAVEVRLHALLPAQGVQGEIGALTSPLPRRMPPVSPRLARASLAPPWASVWTWAGPSRPGRRGRRSSGGRA